MKSNYSFIESIISVTACYQELPHPFYQIWQLLIIKTIDIKFGRSAFIAVSVCRTSGPIALLKMCQFVWGVPENLEKEKIPWLDMQLG